MSLEKLNIFGASGYIGGNFMKQFPNGCLDQERENRIPKSENPDYWILRNMDLLISEIPEIRTSGNPYA